MEICELSIDELKVETLPVQVLTQWMQSSPEQQGLIFSRGISILEKIDGTYSDEDDFILTNILDILTKVKTFKAVELAIKIHEHLDYLWCISSDASKTIEGFSTEKYFDDLHALWIKLEKESESKTTILRALCFTGKIDQSIRDSIISSCANPNDLVSTADAMMMSRDRFYLPILEEYLTSIAFLIKYLPQVPLSSGYVEEHRYWIEVGTAWASLFTEKEPNNTPDFDLNKERSEELNLKIKLQEIFSSQKTRDAILKKHFLDNLPSSVHEWLDSPNTCQEKKALFMERKKSYDRLLDAISDAKKRT